MEEKIKLFIDIIDKVLNEVIEDKNKFYYDEDFKKRLSICLCQTAEDYFIKKNMGVIKKFCVKELLIKHLKFNNIDEIEILIENSLINVLNSSKKNIRKVKIKLLKLCLLTTKNLIIHIVSIHLLKMGFCVSLSCILALLL